MQRNDASQIGSTALQKRTTKDKATQKEQTDKPPRYKTHQI